MEYSFNQFAADMDQLHQQLLAAAEEGEVVDLTFTVYGDRSYSAGSLYIRVGEQSIHLRLRKGINSHDDPRECIEWERMDSEGADTLMTYAFHWVARLPSPSQRKLAESVRALERARELATAAGVEGDAFNDLLEAAIKVGGNLLPPG